MVHKDKLWIKFKELDMVCWCDYINRKCGNKKVPDCHLYLTKFIQIDDDLGLEDLSKKSKDFENQIRKERHKFESELKRNIDKIKRFKI